MTPITQKKREKVKNKNRFPGRRKEKTIWSSRDALTPTYSLRDEKRRRRKIDGFSRTPTASKTPRA